MPVQGLFRQIGIPDVPLRGRLPWLPRTVRSNGRSMPCSCCDGWAKSVPHVDAAGDVPSSYASLFGINGHTLQEQTLLEHPCLMPYSVAGCPLISFRNVSSASGKCEGSYREGLC